MAEKNFQVFIGLGGAGGSCLAEMAELVANDFKLGELAEQHLSFIVVDTDEQAIADTCKRIRRALEDYCDPKLLEVNPLHLGQPFTHEFSKHVAGMFYDARNSAEAKKKLLECWWTHTDGQAYMFEGVIDVTKGSGQMPLASRIMAWWNRDSIAETVASVVNECKRRNVAGTNIDIYFVSSLAGGTGRGCWATLGFMFREAFARAGMKITPIGIFLDAGCFPVPEPPKKDQARIRLNSLTGISEVKMWLHNARNRDAKIAYQVPDLKRPDDETVNVIDAVRASMAGAEREKQEYIFKNCREGDPVDFAFFIFKGNRQVPGLSASKYYQRLVGQVLYGCLRDDYIQQFAINNQGAATPMFSIGSSIVSIPSDAVRDYLRVLAQERIIGREVVDDWSDEEIRKVSAGWSKMLPMLDLRASVDKYIASVVSDDPARRKLNEALTKQNLAAAKTAARAVDQTQAVANLGACLLEWHRNLFPQVHKRLDGARPEWLDEPHEFITDGIVRMVFEKARGNEITGLGEWKLDHALKALQIADDYLKTLSQSLNTGTAGGMGENLADTAPAVAYQEIVERFQPKKKVEDLVAERSGRSGVKGLFGVGERFDEEEIKEIAGLSKKWLEFKNASEFDRALRTACESAREELGQVKASVKRLLAAYHHRVESFRSLAAGLEKIAFLVLSGDGATDFNILMPRDKYDTLSKIHLILRIPLDDKQRGLIREKVDEWVGGVSQTGGRKTNVQATNAAAVAAQIVCHAALEECHQPGELDRSRLGEFEREINTNLERAAAQAEVGTEFINEHFTIVKVLQQYIESYARTYEGLPERKAEELRKQIELFFGYTVGGSSLPAAEDALANLAAYLAGNCHPWVELHSGVAERDRVPVVVWLPRGASNVEELEGKVYDSRAAQQFNLGRADGAGQRPMSVKIQSSDLNAFYNPFAIVAMSYIGFPDWDASKEKGTQNFGGIASVDYWRDDENLKGMLEAAEADGPGLNLAVGGAPRVDSQGGIGYVDPRFVAQAGWRRLRWRPWVPERQQNLETVDAKAKAFAYLCVGNFAPNVNNDAEVSATLAAASSVLSRLAEETKWRLPIAERAGTIWTWKRKLKVNGDVDGEYLTDFGWKVSDQVKSLNAMFKFIEQMPPNHVANVDWEIERFREHLKALELDSARLKALKDATVSFLQWVRETDALENYKGRVDDQETLQKFVAGATRSVTALFEDIK
jgi:Tubulin like